MLNIDNSTKLMKSIGFTEVLLSDYKKDFESKTFQGVEGFEATKKTIMSLIDVDDNLIKKFAVYKIGEKLVYIKAWTLFKTIEDKITLIKNDIIELENMLVNNQFDILPKDSIIWHIDNNKKKLKDLVKTS
jgi:hypothetical protein